MSFIEHLKADTLGSLLTYFRPELAICVTIVVMLLARMICGRKLPSGLVVLIGTGLALYWCEPGKLLGEVPSVELFTGLLVYDKFTLFFRTFLLAFTVLFVIFTWISGIPDKEDSADFFTLALGGVLGMCLMASSNHLLMVFVAVEMASVPSYALSGMLKGRRSASEAALKYSVYGAGTAGIMLYGISLLAGVTGTVHLPTLAVRLAEVLGSGADGGTLMVLGLGGLMLMVGLAFKLSAVPFHFWCPDVFEGASAEVNAFLSVASKAAALALLTRVALGVGFVPSDRETPVLPDNAVAAAEVPRSETETLPQPKIRTVSFLQNETEEADVPVAPQVKPDATEEKPADTNGSSPSDTPPADLPEHDKPEHEGHGNEHPAGEHPADLPAEPLTGRAAQNQALQPVRMFIANLVALLAALTATFGNLAAYGQTNIKRLLAYSTIAHAGYMMMPISAAMALAGSPTQSSAAIASMCLYVAMYLFMNLGAFAIVAFLRNAMRSEEIADYAGLIRQCPGVVVCFSTILLSLLGLPPLAGFAAKFLVFGSLVDAHLWTLLVIGGLNTVLSLFYYLRVVKVMVLDPEPADREPIHLPIFLSTAGLFVLVVTLPVVLLGIFWEQLNVWANAAGQLLM